MNVLTLISEKTRLGDDIINDGIKLVERYGGKVKDVSYLSINNALDIFFENVSPKVVQEEFKKAFDIPVDAVAQPMLGRRKKMLISDMDSTLIHQECIDELADFVGLKDKVSEITELAMNGEICFKEALRERVMLLQGLSETVFEEVYNDSITMMEGAKTLTQTMRKNGAFCLLVSGGFTVFTSKVRDNLGFHKDISNIFEIKDGFLTGKVLEPIHDKDSKLNALNKSVAELGITNNDVIAVGDGANDMPMLLASGMGTAYHGKPFVRNTANFSVDYNDLTALLYVQGYKDEEFIF